MVAEAGPERSLTQHRREHIEHGLLIFAIQTGIVGIVAQLKNEVWDARTGPGIERIADRLLPGGVAVASRAGIAQDPNSGIDYRAGNRRSREGEVGRVICRSGRQNSASSSNAVVVGRVGSQPGESHHVIVLAGRKSRFVNRLVESGGRRPIADATQVVERVAPADRDLGGRSLLEIRAAGKRSRAGYHIDVNNGGGWRRVVVVVVGNDLQGVAPDGCVGPIETVRKGIVGAEESIPVIERHAGDASGGSASGGFNGEGAAYGRTVYRTGDSSLPGEQGVDFN